MDGNDAVVNFIRKMVVLESFEQLKCKEKCKINSYSYANL